MCIVWVCIVSVLDFVSSIGSKKYLAGKLDKCTRNENSGIDIHGNPEWTLKFHPGLYCLS